MARGNRRENRAAAKAMLETPAEDKNALKQEKEDQADFFAAAAQGDDNIDILEDEDDMDANAGGDEDKEGEVEGEDKTSPAPNVESGDADADDDASAGDEAKGDDAGDEEVGDDAETSTESGKPEDKKPADEKKPAEPAPKDDGKEKEKEQQTTPSELSNEDAAKLYGEWRSQTEELLATHHYRLDEKMVEELNANPAAFIPKMMSKVYMDSISAAFQQFTQYLPRMVSQVLEQREVYNTSERKFFETWPALEQHKDTVMRLGATYRTQNPKASMDDFIKEVGAQAMVALRLLPNDVIANANGNGKKEASTGQKPFKPATTAPGGMPNKPRAPSNPFEQLADDFAFEEEVGED